MRARDEIVVTCPVSLSDYPSVLMAHGGGGRLMNNLLDKMILPSFRNPLLETRHDGAVFNTSGVRLAFTSDSYVVHPLFFPGGDIGRLAVFGTVNDLAMCGARPAFLSASFIIEEGFSMETLWRVVNSMKEAAEEAGVMIVTGDTKVVDKGKGDGIFVNTAGVGILNDPKNIGPGSVKPEDAILISGDVGRHGMAIMMHREGLDFEGSIESDAAPLGEIVMSLLESGVEVHCLRDLTRGGLASALVEIARCANLSFQLEESNVPVDEYVRGACEILGFDPFYVANEGRFVCFLPADQATSALEILRAHPLGKKASLIGRVVEKPAGRVTVKTPIGGSRILDMLSGEQLPRIC